MATKKRFNSEGLGGGAGDRTRVCSALRRSGRPPSRSPDQAEPLQNPAGRALLPSTEVIERPMQVGPSGVGRQLVAHQHLRLRVGDARLVREAPVQMAERVPAEVAK